VIPGYEVVEVVDVVAVVAVVVTSPGDD